MLELILCASVLKAQKISTAKRCHEMENIYISQKHTENHEDESRQDLSFLDTEDSSSERKMSSGPFKIVSLSVEHFP